MRTLIFFLIIAMTSSCTQNTSDKDAIKKSLDLTVKELDSLKRVLDKAKLPAKELIKTFLTFQKQDAEEAMNFYVGLFENSKITSVQRYGKDGPAKEGTIMFATFELNGSAFACSDSYAKHEWDFTPGVSIFVECASDTEIQHLFTKLSENGKVLMPLNNYGFSTKFGFVEDRFGVSWQLNLL